MAAAISPLVAIFEITSTAPYILASLIVLNFIEGRKDRVFPLDGSCRAQLENTICPAPPERAEFNDREVEALLAGKRGPEQLPWWRPPGCALLERGCR